VHGYVNTPLNTIVRQQPYCNIYSTSQILIQLRARASECRENVFFDSVLNKNVTLKLIRQVWLRLEKNGSLKVMFSFIGVVILVYQLLNSLHVIY